jgi:hypothetical protein
MDAAIERPWPLFNLLSKPGTRHWSRSRRDIMGRKKKIPRQALDSSAGFIWRPVPCRFDDGNKPTALHREMTRQKSMSGIRHT